MGLHSGGFSDLEASRVAGDPNAMMKDFQAGSCPAQVDLLANQGIGDTVIMALEFNVIVDVHACLLPLGQFVGLHRKGT